jgi:CysZ protein
MSLITGFGYFFDGFGLILKKGVRPWALWPLAINALLFAAVIGYTARHLQDWLARLDAWLPEWLHWLHWLIWPLFIASAALALFFGFTLAANFIAAPFNGALAAAVERHLTGAAPPDSGSLWQEVLTAFADQLGKLWYYLTRLPPVLLLLWIPGVNLAFPLFWFAFCAWILAVEYADYPMGNHALRFAEQRRRLGRKRWLSLGFGGGALLAASVPGVNLLAMPVAVAGATAMWVGEFKRLPGDGA